MKIYISILLAFGLQAFAQTSEQGLSLKEKRERCYFLMVEEFKNILSTDSPLLQAKLTHTGIKLAQSLLAKEGEESKGLKAYARSLVGKELLDKLENDPKTMEKVLSLYEARGDNKQVYSPKLEVYADLQKIVGSEKLTDDNVSNFIAHLAAKGENFDEEDVAVAWFVNRASLNFDGKESRYISGIVRAVLEAKGEERDKLIAKNLARARLKIKAGLARTKEKVLEANRSLCLSDYESLLNAQHRSVFQGCRAPEESIVDSAFLKGLGSILHSRNCGTGPFTGACPRKKRKLTSDKSERRKTKSIATSTRANKESLSTISVVFTPMTADMSDLYFGGQEVRRNKCVWH